VISFPKQEKLARFFFHFQKIKLHQSFAMIYDLANEEEKEEEFMTSFA
jgi:hypothetical protein